MKSSFRKELQAVAAYLCDKASDREELRKALRKGVPSEQWQTIVRLLFESLHPRDAIAVRSATRIVRPLENVAEEILIHTETRSANMRIQAAGKEPWTYSWLGAMQPGEVLYDVGANVGAYSLIGLRRGLKVVAFEPHHESFRELCRNAALNGLSDALIALPLALSDAPELVRNPIGAACDTAGETLSLGAQTGPLSIVACRLDDLVAQYGLPLPNHVKIDVDGFEGRVLLGARETLAGAQVRSCLVEVDERSDVPGRWGREEVAAFLAASGLVPHAVTLAMAEGVNYLVGTRGNPGDFARLELRPLEAV